jgi:hypothetical protein
MNFIEQLFGLAPDNGSGTFELLLLAVPFVIVSLLYLGRSGLRKRRR